MDRVKRQVLFDQDRLDAYNLERDFVRAVEGLLERVPRGFAEQSDQVRRASLSITLNTAEGAGESRPAGSAPKPPFTPTSPCTLN